MTTKIERRYLNELRADSQGDELSLVGYAAVFNTPSEDLGGFRETILPGAFTRSLREGADVKCLMNHDPSLMLGRVKNGTLTLEEDAKGLRYRVVLPLTQTARDLYALVKRGDIDECSFAFTARSQSWEDARDANGDMYASRKLMDVNLLDVSAVTNPAYSGTQVSARTLFPDGEPAEVRSALDAHAAAKALAQRGKDGAAQVDGKSSLGDKEQRGSEAQPIDHTAISLPQPFDPKLKAEWFDAFDGAYSKLMKKGGRGYAIKEALALAIAQANLEVQPETETPPEEKGGKGKDPTDIPHEVVPTDAAGRARVKAMHLRYSEGTYEDLIADINCALKEKYGLATGSNGWCCPGGPKYWVIETFPDHVVVMDSDEVNCYYSIPYTYDAKAEEGKEVSLGDTMTKLEQQYVPSARALKIGQQRVYKSAADVPDYVPDDKKAQWKEVWNSAYAKALKDGKSKDEAEKSAFAQANGVAGPKAKREGDGTDNTDPDDNTTVDPVTGLPKVIQDVGQDPAQDEDDEDIVELDSKPAAAGMRSGDKTDVKDDAKLDKDKGSPGDQDKAKDGPNKRENDFGCQCPCEDCVGDDCESCSNEACTDENCIGCPNQIDGEGDGIEGELNGRKTKTVAGRALTADEFAWVGNPTDIKTWKLRVDDAGHVQAALFRFNQTKGIPADRKEDVWKNIVAAAKKFGIDVSEEKSLRAGIKHEVTLAAFSAAPEPEFDAEAATRAAQVRMIEIELSL